MTKKLLILTIIVLIICNIALIVTNFKNLQCKEVVIKTEVLNEYEIELNENYIDKVNDEIKVCIYPMR